jgi:uncharacterized MAPEG superfamily protein
MTLALWCVLIAALLPILTTGVAKGIGSGGKPQGFDNANPRDWQAGLQGMARRAHAAHLNAFEAFPLFAAAVLVAEIKGAAGSAVDLLAVVFVLARMAYAGAYMADRATLRSICWAVAFFAAIAIFLAPLWA